MNAQMDPIERMASELAKLLVVVALHQQLRGLAGAHHTVIEVQHYISLLPSMAFESVTSSAYSRSLPTGTPWAMRVTLMPMGLTSRAI